jgi:fructokinase
VTGSAPLLAVIGEALIDLSGAGDDDPWLARPGGSPYNVAIGLARLERHTAFVGRLSGDPLGAILRDHAQRSGVDLAYAVAATEPTTIALVELVGGIAEYRFGVDGTADFCWTDAELARLPDDVAVVHFGSLASWLAPGDAAIARRVAQLRETALISYDPNVRPSLQPDRDAARGQVEAGVALADLVKTSADDLAWLYGDADPADVAAGWLALGAALVVVTSGGDGSVAYTGRDAIRRPVRRVDVVDTVGAGDAFMAGLLDALAGRGVVTRGALRKLDRGALADVLDAAALVAALTCARAGANPPRRAERDAARR